MKQLTVALACAALLAVSATGCGYDPFGMPDENGGEGAAAEADAPPAFGDLHREIFEAMLSAESVTISGEVEAGDADVDELFDDIDGETAGQLEISGALDGTESQMSFTAGGSSFTQRAVEGREFFRGEDFAALLVSELDDEVTEVVNEELIEEIVADQWVQFDDAEQPSVFSAEDFITTWRDELDGDEVGTMTAESDTHDGEPVWVYTADGGDSRFVVAASGDPYLLAISDEDSSYEFAEWNESPLPDVPEQVITLDEIFDAIADEQGWSTDEQGDEDADTEDDDSQGGTGNA